LSVPVESDNQFFAFLKAPAEALRATRRSLNQRAFLNGLMVNVCGRVSLLATAKHG